MRSDNHKKPIDNPKLTTPNASGLASRFLTSRFNTQSPKHTCDQSAYLFWKVQSRLAKLTNRLRLEKKIILQEQTQRSLNAHLPIKDDGTV